MKSNKILAIAGVLVVALSLGTLSFARGEIDVSALTPRLPAGITRTRFGTNHVSKVDVTITEPVAGEACSWDVTTTSKGVKDVSLIWTNISKGASIVKEGTKYIGGDSYCLTVFAGLEEGYEWASEITYTINGEAPERTYDQPNVNQKSMVQYYMAQKVIDTVEVIAKEPVLGGLPNEEVTVKTEGLGNAYIGWINNASGVGMKSTEKYEDGGSYILRAFARPSAGYIWADKVTFKINGKEVVGKKLVGENTGNQMYGDLEFTVGTAKKLIDTVVISYEEPVVGEANSTEITTKTEGIKEAKMTWVDKTNGLFMTKGENFKEGNEYEARIYVYQADGYKWADKVILKINGKSVEGATTATSAQTTMTYTLEEEKLEEKTEEKVEEKVEYPWTKISSWAETELIEANEKGLIPTCLENKDYTKNITRAEFAAAVVKLYEGITKTKAVAIANNPFTDTKDTEILKAYNLGITNGISETTFAPNAEITREQMATMMTRALTKAGINTKKPASVVVFADDSEISSWATDSVYYMSSIEIIKGVGANTFNSKGTATRDQALAVSIRSFNKLGK